MCEVQEVALNLPEWCCCQYSCRLTI